MAAETKSRIERLAEDLRGITIHTEPRFTITYNYDATGLKGACGGVAFPESLGDMCRIVTAASRRGVPVYVRGAGTGFSGGAIPLGKGLVVSVERLSRVLRFDQEAESVEVECGIINEDLQNYLLPLGFFYPPDPASMKFSTIGGNIAENAGGPRAYKYGVTRRYVHSMTWVTSEGEALTSTSDGPSALLVGAEGTLGIIYSAVLGVLPLPAARRTSFLSAGGDGEAMGLASRLLSTGFCPSVLEFIDSKTMQCVSEYRRLEGLSRGQSHLFVEIDGSEEEVAGQYGLLEEFCQRREISLTTAADEAERELLWEVRRSVSPSLARRGITKVNEDVSLPLGSLVEAVPFIHELARGMSLDCYIFGHCGDGNLHVNIMTDRRKKEEMKRVEGFVEELFAYVARQGGSLSGEHGVGMTKSRYLGTVFDLAELELQRGIKAAMDEREVLNLGKYFGS